MRVLLVPSSNLVNTKARCKIAVKYWRSGGFDLIVLSGGTYPNALLMKMWINDACASDSSKIITDNRSLDTYQNIEETLKLIKARFPGRHLSEITVVTNWQQGLRFCISLRRGFGVKNVHIWPSYEPTEIKQWLF